VEGSVSKDIASGLWAANPHEFGPGKIHLVDAQNEEKTLCGKWLRAVPGKQMSSGRATCKICLNAVENRAHSRILEEERRREQERLERQRGEQNREWWARYDAYLRSPAWRQKADLVKKRAGGMCEGCGTRIATQVHHVTYEHVCNEFLWELRAICNECHERIHGEQK
jgi:hypothetical protein